MGGFQEGLGLGGSRDGLERVLLTALGWSWVALGWSNACNRYLGQFGMVLGVWECFGWFCDVSAKGGVGGFQDGLGLRMVMKGLRGWFWNGPGWLWDG